MEGLWEEADKRISFGRSKETCPGIKFNNLKTKRKLQI